MSELDDAVELMFSGNLKESYFWQQVKAGLSAPDVDLSRIENTAGTGISDVSACCGGFEVWLELKVFHGKYLHFRNSQRTWINRRHEVGGVIYVLARKDDEMFLYVATEVLACPFTSTKKGGFIVKFDDLPTSVFHCRKPFKWNDLKNTIWPGRLSGSN